MSIGEVTTATIEIANKKGFAVNIFHPTQLSAHKCLYFCLSRL